MTMILKTAVIAFVLAGSSIVSGCMSDRDARYGRDYRDSAAVSVDFGNVAFGYQDGYWDNGHAWHQWSDDRHRQSYRNHRGNRYNDWKHDRDGGDGWRQGDSR
jgi:hypothetical protein